jgi:serine/threonine protein kinase
LEDPSFYFLVFEYAERGSLASVITGQGPMPEPQVRRCFTEILSALHYLHNVSCVPHRDLHPRHVLFDTHGHIKLIDFGLSVLFGESDPLTLFSPPELFSGDRYTTATDIWNAGVLLSAMISGELPPGKSTLSDLRQRIARPRVPIPRAMSPLAADLVSLLIRPHPEERPALPQVLAHEWLPPRFVGVLHPEPPSDHTAAEMLRSFRYCVDPDVAAVCRIVERRILAEHVHAAMRGAPAVVPQVRSRFRGPLTPGMRRVPGLPVQVPEVAKTHTQTQRSQPR